MRPIVDIEERVKGKKVLFVSTKNRDYIRNTQEITWLKEQASDFESVCHQSSNYLVRLAYVYLHLLPKLIKKDYDILFLGFAPQLIFPLFPFVSKKKTVIFDFFISFYDTLVDDRKKIKKESFIAKVIHGWDKKTIQRADYIIVDTIAHGKYFAEEFMISLDKISVYYISADVSIYHPHPRKKNSRFEVVYFGSILPVQGIDIVLDAIKLLRSEEQIHFTLIGPIEKKFQINPLDFPNTTFISWVSQQELAEYINQADLTLAGHFSSTVGKANRTIAGKTYIYLAMNKKVILGDSDANHELYQSSEDIYYVERGNPGALATLINEIAMEFLT